MNLRDALDRSRLSPQTRRLYREAVARYIAYAKGKRLLDDALAIKYVASRLDSGATQSTVNVDVSALTYAFKKCGRKFPVKRGAGGGRVLTTEEVRRLLGLLENANMPTTVRDALLIERLLQGARPTELVRDKIEDYEQDSDYPGLIDRWAVTVLKAGFNRGPLYRAVRSYKAIDGHDVIGAPLGVLAIRRIVRERGRQAGIVGLTSRVLYQTWKAGRR